MIIELCYLFAVNMASANLLYGEVTMSHLNFHQTSPNVEVLPSRSVAEVLHSSGPSSELGSAASVYDWLIGSWDVRVIDYDDEGSTRESRGEWHFSWVLEGRAVQDVFIVPSKDQRSAQLSKEGNRYGTTLRIYDPEIKAWRITWFNPVRNVENHLVGKKVGNEIIQEGSNENGSARMRWSFRDIKENSFRWTGEESPDNGKTWRLGAEFFGVRMDVKPDLSK
jgi:hypothetical protein